MSLCLSRATPLPTSTTRTDTRSCAWMSLLYQACAAGKYRGTTGAKDVAECVDCVAGKYSTDNAEVCIECDANTWSAAGTAATCTSCGTNAVSPAGSTAATACKCDAGFYGPLATSTQSSVTCTSCGSNANSPSASTSASACKCDAGFYGADITTGSMICNVSYLNTIGLRVGACES